MAIMRIASKAVVAVCVTCVLVSAEINTSGQNGLLRTISPQTLGQAKLNVMLGVNLASDNDFIQDVSPPPGYLLKDTWLLSGNLAVAFGLTSFWDIAIGLPYFHDWPDKRLLDDDGGLGDLEISMKLRQPIVGKIFYQGYYIAGTIPTGMDGGLFPRNTWFYDVDTYPDVHALNPYDLNPAENKYGLNSVALKGLLLCGLDFSKGKRKIPLAMDLNFGAVAALDFKHRHSAIGSFALSSTPTEFVTIFAELWAQPRLFAFSHGLKILRDPIFISPGIRLNTPAGLSVLLAGDFCLSSNEAAAKNYWKSGDLEYSTKAFPTWGGQVVLSWSGFLSRQDDDRDGIKNDEDRCPQDPEDIDGFEDDDGCPDPDNDGDRILDVDDKCPNDPEDFDGFEDEDGCPDLDNDGDGIPDVKDRCPNDAEDFDGFEDSDGCPDPDNDKDGVPDSLDRCPNDPEDFDNFQDDDGCPDLDNDQDGIPDLKDKCPNEPETFNGYMDDDGCPDTVSKKKECRMPKHQILRGVEFASGKTTLGYDMYRFIEPIVASLKECPDVEIEIRGHTDSVGKYDMNMRFSQLRAEAIRQYLMTQGIDGARMRAVGYGPTSPVADNRTADGRARNRRIEIVRLK